MLRLLTTRKKKAQWPSTSFYKFFFLFYFRCLLAGFFFVKIASSTTRCERKDKLYWYAGMRRMCANKQGELCEADTKGVDLRSGRGNRGLGHFPPSSKRNNFPLIRVYVEGASEGLLYNSLPRANPSPASAQNFWLCRRM